MNSITILPDPTARTPFLRSKKKTWKEWDFATLEKVGGNPDVPLHDCCEEVIRREGKLGCRVCGATFTEIPYGDTTAPLA